MSDIVRGHRESEEYFANKSEHEKLKAEEAKVKLAAMEAKHLANDYVNSKVGLPAPQQEAMRFDDDKMRLDLMPPEAELELARVYTMGAIKYADDNWRKGMSYRKCYGALRRHLLLWLSGQSVDPETGCHHLAQVAWNALTLMVYEMRGLGKDDRIKFNIDKDFNWIDNPLKIGLSKEEIQALKLKYKDRK